MPRIFAYRFIKGDHEYNLDVSIDDEALVKDSLSFAVTAQYRHLKEDHWQTVTVSLDYDFGENQITATFDGIAVPITLSLKPFIDEVKSIVADAITPGLDRAIERIIQGVPVPDPIFGCLLKAGISTLVGQLLRCLQQIREVPTFGQRVRETARCLRHNGIAMLSTAARRTFMCMVTLGIF
jgi:hypothetical protein